MDKKLRICIVGPGAIGGVVAGVLARKGYNIQMVAKHKDLAEKISTPGIEVSGYCGDFIQPIPSVATGKELEGIFDYVLIATKGDALEDAATGVLPYLDENSRVVSMQNGICEDILAGVVGLERTIGCVVAWGGTMHAPGNVEMTSGGEFVLGNWKREPDEKLEILADILGNIIETRISRNILSELYSKMIINSCITTLGVISGLYLGEILVKKKARDLFIEVIREAINVAWAMGITVAPGAGGKLQYYKFVAPGFLSGFKRHLIIRVIGMKYKKIKSSSLQSLERGRKTEVDNYNGYISAKGRKFNVPTPVNNQLTRMVKEIEEGKRQISPENFNELNL
ncbi:MAG: 2-dehydropantoate 2-reductase [Bacteroidota bacterium]